MGGDVCLRRMGDRHLSHGVPGHWHAIEAHSTICANGAVLSPGDAQANEGVSDVGSCAKELVREGEVDTYHCCGLVKSWPLTD